MITNTKVRKSKQTAFCIFEWKYHNFLNSGKNKEEEIFKGGRRNLKMFDLVPFKKNNLIRNDEFFTPFLKTFFDDDFFTAMKDIQGNFRVDLKETENNYLVEAELPGVKREAINIDFENNHLTISAKREETLEDEKGDYVRRERHYGEFKRQFYVDNVDEDKIEATFKDGVLKIILPKLTKGKDKKKKIDIH